MNKLIVIILSVYCDNVFGEGIKNEEQKSTDLGVIGNFPNKYAVNFFNERRQKYPGIWIRADKNGQGGYDNDDNRYGQNGDNNNRYVQGIRIGVNRYVGNQFNNQENLHPDLLFNAGLRAGLSFNPGIRTSLDFNAGLGAGLDLNTGLGMNAGMSLGAAGLRLGLDLSTGGDQDMREDLVRPCQMEDYQCIRKLFAENSQCNPSYGPSPDPIYMDQHTLHLPNINLTYTLTNLKVTGMASAKISDLYINRVTGNVVISIQIKDLHETSPKVYLSYKRKGKEPIILADAASIKFPSVILTVVIPRIPNLRLDLADIHAYVDDSAPAFNIGPGANACKDPDVTAAFLQLSTNFRFAIQEGFLFHAPLLAALFIQVNVCDFGVHLTSV